MKFVSKIITTAWILFVLYVVISTISKIISLPIDVPEKLSSLVPPEVSGAIELSQSYALPIFTLIWMWIAILVIYAVQSYLSDDEGLIYRKWEWCLSYIYTFATHRKILKKYVPGSEEYRRLAKNTPGSFQNALSDAHRKLANESKWAGAKPSNWADYLGVRDRKVLRHAPWPMDGLIYDYSYRKALEALIVNRMVRKAAINSKSMTHAGLYLKQGPSGLIAEADRSLGLVYPVSENASNGWMVIAVSKGIEDCIPSVGAVLDAMCRFDDIYTGYTDPDSLDEYALSMQRLETVNKCHPLVVIASEDTMDRVRERDIAMGERMSTDEVIRFYVEEIRKNKP